jgi:4-hydroxybenzoyl-CoA reductase subunit beta
MLDRRTGGGRIQRVQLPNFEYLRPASLSHALDLLAAHGGRAAVLAGGTDLLISMRQRLLMPEVVIGIGALPELKSVAIGADGSLRIGAACTLTSLIRHPVVRDRYPSLAAAMKSVGSRHVRNAATLGGNLNLPTRCWYTNQSESWREARPPCFKTNGDICFVIRSARECFALNSADSAVALMTLGARLFIESSAGGREIAIGDFYRNDGLKPTTLGSNELVTAVQVPAHRDRTVFLKVAERTGLDYGLGTIAAAVTGGNRRVTSARLVVGTIGSWPVSLHESARMVEQDGLTPAVIEAAAEAARGDLGELTNLYSPAGYKRRLVRALVRRALTELRRQKPLTEESA